MRFAAPLQKGTLIKRYKRFLADVTLENGQQVTAHCPNTGSMKTCGSPGDHVYLSYHDSPTRKLAYTWELTATKGGFVGIHTGKTNGIVYEAIIGGHIPGLTGYQQVKKEVKYGNSRIDLKLEGHQHHPHCWVEVKNVTLLDHTTCLFPDAVTQRGTKHLNTLIELKQQGERAVIFYVVNRPEAQKMMPAASIDPEYARTLRYAVECGVEALAYRVDTNLKDMKLAEQLPIEFTGDHL